MDAFFDLTTEYAPQSGFGMFSPGHFCALAACALLACGMCRLYRRASSAGRARLRRAVGMGALAAELARAALLMAAGQYGIGRLPLHLCALAAYISALHSLRGGELTGQFLYAFCMPGALFALIFPDWCIYPFFHFMTLTGFFGHWCIVVYTLMQAAAGDIKPQTRLLPPLAAVMLCAAVPVYIFDRITDTNYMFLNWPSPGSPLEWFSFLGRPGYIAGYIPLIAAVWAALYLPAHRRRRAEEE